ncbi:MULTISPECIES: hypothetical protein [unclassified Rhizobium]|nr:MULTISPECIES: hypothetical protein [unclassified Rhizobium]MBB3394305.1 hypothetical protein [Rhizobium sp. BK060]MBB4169657.1 hypothetical protein [Rhizobium sp. BK538]
MIEKNHRESNECCHAQLSATLAWHPVSMAGKKDGRQKAPVENQ